MFKKICKSSISAIVLMGLLGAPEFSLAMEVMEDIEDFSDEHFSAVGIHDLPDEMLTAVIYKGDPRTQATLRMICRHWMEIIDSTPYLDLLGKYNRAMDKEDELVRANKKRPDPESLKKQQAETLAILRHGQPLVSLHSLLMNGNQNYLIHNRERLALFLRAALVNIMLFLPRRLHYIADHYPRVFHACHRNFLQTLSDVSGNLEQNW